LNFCPNTSRAKCISKEGPSWPILSILFALIVGLGVLSPSASGTAPKKVARAIEPAGAPVKAYGSKDAPLTMEVFTDYQCPSCRNFYENTLRLMINDYVASGKVYLIHHDFPLSMHKYSGEAARWATAAARVGEFGSVEAALYDNQDAWGADGNIAKYVSAAMSAAQFKRVEAIMASCNYPAIQSRVDGSNPLAQIPHPCALDTYIDQDIELGYHIPVQATPTYIISYKGQHLPATSYAVSWPILKQFLDSLLNQ
jgi:protein-disulfide isomerase